MTSGIVRTQGFDFARVVTRTFAVVGQNLSPLLLASLILTGVPTVLGSIGQNAPLYVPGGQALDVLSPISGILSFICGLVLQGFVTSLAVNTLGDRRISAREAFSAGANTLLPLLGLSIVMGLGIALGLIILIVPGLFLMVIWAVAPAIVVIERSGIMESLQRSRELTRGSRWSIFGLMVIFLVGAVAVGGAVFGLILAAEALIDSIGVVGFSPPPPPSRLSAP